MNQRSDKRLARAFLIAPPVSMTMRPFTPFTNDRQITRIGEGLIDRTLPKPEWTHSGHFAAALWILSEHPRLDAAAAMPGLIRAYNEATGVANTETGGYHETITQASLQAAKHILRAFPRVPLFETCNRLMTSNFGEPDWLLAYWSRHHLFSVQARAAWLDPDIAPLPF